MIYTIFEIFFLFILLISINFILKTKKILIDKPEYSKHKLIITSGTPLSGGLLIMIMLFYNNFFYSTPNSFIILCVSILILGLVADTNKNFSVKIRFLFQTLILISFIIIYDLEIPTLRHELLDSFLLNSNFNKVFIFLCLITLLNGLNFIDGVNGLSSGYFFLINLILFFLFSEILKVDEFIKNLNLLLIKIYLIFFIFNIFGKCFFGDNGIYISLICNSLIIITIFQFNYKLLSPYFIASILWYPAFENLFTILRRIKNKKKLIEPDNFHLHYLLMNNINLINFLKKQKKFISNSLTGILINLFLLPGFIFAYLNYDNSKLLLLNILIYLIMYILIYILLLRNLLKSNEKYNL